MSAPADRDLERALFDACLGLADTAGREAFLVRACAGDDALKDRVRRLLAAHGEAEKFIPDVADSRPPLSPLPATAGPASESSVSEGAEGSFIGRYRLVRRIGEGGCGVVYLAEQCEPVRRRVALKVIRLGMDTERVVARFALERQALALMNHPNVAQVLDAGATESGRPYFVMELVEGERITDFCRNHRLGVRERLELFIPVCHAIQHAHQKGILHRDIKPSNVLVTMQDGVPVPKVIDFGVAKAVLGPQAGDATRTGDGMFLGTPAYMSPEQAEPGRIDVDTRSDVYSLGALLHELLVDRPPFDSRRLLEAGLDELRRTLREVEPAAPSRFLRALPSLELAQVSAARSSEPPALVKALKRDLDWIVLRALEKDRARRYATVNGLALDLARHLRDEPVEARPTGGFYRLRKLVRRNRVLFAASVAVALALVAGLGVSTRLFVRERVALREQTALRRQAETAERLTRAAFLTREGSFEAAARVLDGIGGPLTQPSFDGMLANRAVGDWLASQRRWSEAAARFAVALELGRLDILGPVTVDHQCYGVASILAGDEAAYQRFRARSAERFFPANNSDAVARVLKTCLLRSLTPALRERLLPLGKRTEFWFSSLNPRLAAGWAVVPVSLWSYRGGDYEEARRLAQAGDDPADVAGARGATLRLIIALCDLGEGRREEAAARLEAVRPVIAAGFEGDLTKGDARDGHWYDWAYAHILMQEAERLLGDYSGAAPEKI